MMMSIPFTVQILKLSYTKIAAQKGDTWELPRESVEGELAYTEELTSGQSSQ
jgi:hypothetical protein